MFLAEFPRQLNLFESPSTTMTLIIPRHYTGCKDEYSSSYFVIDSRSWMETTKGLCKKCISPWQYSRRNLHVCRPEFESREGMVFRLKKDLNGHKQLLRT